MYDTQFLGHINGRFTRAPETKSAGRKTTPKRKSGDKDLATAMQSLSVAEPTSPKGKARASNPPSSPLSVVIAEEAELYLWDMEKEEFNLQSEVTAQIAQPTGVAYEYWLIASTSDGQELAHKITSEMNQRWSTKTLSITWNNFSDHNFASSWLFRFKTPEGYLLFKNVFTQAMWEGLHLTSWDKVKVSVDMIS
jgi:hypothetical protein